MLFKRVARALVQPAYALGALVNKRSMARRSRAAWVLYRLASLLKKERADRYLQRSAAFAALHEFEKAAVWYRKAIRLRPRHHALYPTGVALAKSGTLTDPFFTALLNGLETEELAAMIRHVGSAPARYQPSQFWLYYMTFNALQLEAGGIENFKRTVNNNYFNWTAASDLDAQIGALLKLRGVETGSNRLSAVGTKPVEFSDDNWRRYVQLIELLYEFARQSDSFGMLEMEEPGIGNPVILNVDGHVVTQDLCNTTLELNTIMDHAGFGRNDRFTMCELGAGYGRVGQLLLRAFPNARYVVFDIPPALYVSQWYLTRAFPERKTFVFREFTDYAAVKDEFERASIAFLAADQVEMLPNRLCQIFVNISSLHEMRLDQIENWFGQIDRLCQGVFFSKQFLDYPNTVDGISVKEEDYPVLPRWQHLDRRISPTFHLFFEAAYRVL